MEHQKLALGMAGVVGLGLAAYSLSARGEKPKEEQNEIELSTSGTTYHIGIETGGTGCKVGIFKRVNGKFSFDIDRKYLVDTTTPKETVQKMCDYINNQKDIVFSSMGVAAFGPLCLNKNSSQYGSVTSTPKVAWQQFPLLKSLLTGLDKSRMTPDFKVDFDTDCNILAKFELENGGHKGVSDNLAYITVGTGIGVGFVINGQSIHGLIHPEGGHVSMARNEADIKNYPNFCGVCQFHGCRCVEGLCSNVAIQKRLGLESVAEVAKLSDDHIIWDIVGEYLGTMCANLTLTLSVERIVIGGGVMNRGKVLFDKIREHFKKRLNSYLQHQQLDDLENYIVRSQFENELGMVSASAVGSTGWDLNTFLEKHPEYTPGRA